jgi:hypothetical protein
MESFLLDFNVPLPKEVHSKLNEEAKRSNKAAAELARVAIEDWLRKRKKADLDEAIRAYALAEAGSAADLDQELEADSVEDLLSIEREA